MKSLLKWLIIPCVFAFERCAKKPPISNIAIIGAGAAGLTTAKNALSYEYNVDVYEKSGSVGGLWQYTDDIGRDEFGVDIHSPMYRGLRYV